MLDILPSTVQDGFMTGVVDGLPERHWRQRIFMHKQYVTDMLMELSRDYFVARPFLLRLITADWKVREEASVRWIEGG